MKKSFYFFLAALLFTTQNQGQANNTPSTEIVDFLPPNYQDRPYLLAVTGIANPTPGSPAAILNGLLGSGSDTYVLFVDNITTNNAFLRIESLAKLHTDYGFQDNTGRASWYLKVNTPMMGGSSLTFEFKNKATDRNIRVPLRAGTDAYWSRHEDNNWTFNGVSSASNLKGGKLDNLATNYQVNEWFFSQTYASNLDKNIPVYSYVTMDSIQVLVLDETTGRFLEPASGQAISGGFTVTVKRVHVNDLAGNNPSVSNVLLFTLMQVAETPVLNLSVSPSTLNFVAAGEQKTFDITSNTSWTVSGSNDEWLAYDPASGTGNGTVRVAARVNQTANQRTGTITVSGTGVTAQTVQITQDAANLSGEQSWNLSATMTANLNNAGVLTISTTASSEAMPDFEIWGAPWQNERYNIFSVILSDKITSIGAYAFNECENLTSITLSSSVTAIGTVAFGFCRNLASIMIPNSVKSIGHAAFFYCESLTSITIPNAVTAIAPSAFEHCINLKTVSMPNSVTTIENSTFQSCDNLTTITIPNSVKIIEAHAFYGCTALPSITIPNSVTTIGYELFGYCTNLTSITVEWTTPLSVSFSDNPFIGVNTSAATLHVPAGTKALYQAHPVWGAFGTFVEYGTPAYNLSVSPSTLNFAAAGGQQTFDITSNTNWSVDKGNATWITVSPASGSNNGKITVTVAANTTTNALTGTITVSGTGVTPKTINVTQEAASPTPSLSVSKPALNFTAAGEQQTFDITSNTNWSVDKGNATWLTVSPASGSNNGQITVTAAANTTTNVLTGTITVSGTGVTPKTINVTQEAKQNSNIVQTWKLTETMTATLDDKGVLTISTKKSEGEDMPNFIYITQNPPWYGSNIRSVVIGDNVTSIGECAFIVCNKLTSVIIGNSVTSIGKNAFAACWSLTSITIPNSVITIGEYTFDGCQNLSSVIIGNSVTSIGKYAFLDCRSLTSITIPNSVVAIEACTFLNCEKLTSATIGNSVTSIGERAFYGCWSLTSISIPNSVKSIGDLAFSGSSLTFISIPNSVITIGKNTFSGCQNLSSVIIGNSVNTIGDQAFSWCSSLTSVTIGNSVTTIGNKAFEYCTSLTSVTINGNSETTMGHSVFGYCTGLKIATIGNSITTIGIGMFGFCTSLDKVTIGNSVKTIEEAAFCYCSSLSFISIPNHVKTIGPNAFYFCSNLQDVVIAWNVPPPTIDGIVPGSKINPGNIFDGVNVSSTTLYVPNGTSSLYKEHLCGKTCLGWGDFGKIVEYDASTNPNGPNIPIVNPKLELLTSPPKVKVGEPFEVKGSGFTPNSEAFLRFTGNSNVFMANNVPVNANGEFVYRYDTKELGIGTIRVSGIDRDAFPLKESPYWDFIVERATPLATIVIQNPSANLDEVVNREISISWTEVMAKSNGNYQYPMFNATNRLYDYTISYQTQENGSWTQISKVKGDAFIGSELSRTINTFIDKPTNYFRIRISDNYVTGNTAYSEPCKIIDKKGDFTARLVWDHSFKTPLVAPIPKGVAADGVARLYVKVMDDLKNIRSVAAYLSDPQNPTRNQSNLLGRLHPATVIDKYSSEANDHAEKISISIAPDFGPNSKSEVWFWYVAPDDFIDSPSSPEANQSKRIVRINLVLTRNDGTSEQQTLDVGVVRPPLMLVHGLAASEHSWDNFKIDNSLFIRKNAINLKPGAFFRDNAMTILSPDCANCGVDDKSSNFLNTFQGNISMMREFGYASNQVDYVCHSMGGCVLRTAMTAFNSIFYGTGAYGVGGATESMYKSYEKGFVNKAITINTPHNGSPLADIITEFIPQASDKINQILTETYLAFQYYLPNAFIPWSYIQPLSETLNKDRYTFEATGAIKSLQVMGSEGFKLAETEVKHHLISGNVSISSKSVSFLSEMDPYIDLLDNILTIVRDISPIGPQKTYLNSAMALTKAARVITFVEWYSEQKQFPNYFESGDLIVPLASQLAQTSVPSPLPSNSKVFNNTSFLNANHVNIVDRSDVAEYVKHLLNTSINNKSVFGDKIQANPIQSVQTYKTRSTATDALLTTESHFDTSRVEIIIPFRNDIVYANNTLNVIYQLKNMDNLAYVEYLFQGQRDIIVDNYEYQSIRLNVSPNFLGKQTIYVSAAYDMDDKTVYYIDTLSVNVVTDAKLVDFNINPFVAHIFKGQRYYPQMTAIYESFLSNVSSNSDKLSIRIHDPSVVGYDDVLNCFTGVKVGTTFAEITYENQKDTLYINVMEVYSGDNETSNEIVQPEAPVYSSLDAILYPNPAENDFTVLVNNADNEKIVVSIYNMLGQTIEDRTITGKAAVFNTSSYKRGIYLVRIATASGQSVTKKLIKR